VANTYHQIYLQTVFAVKYREAVIENDWKLQLFSVIGNSSAKGTEHFLTE
jgi:hypothetical protein